MFLSVAVYFLEEDIEEEHVSRRYLRDNSNVLDMPSMQFVANFRVSKDIFVLMLEMLKEKWSPAFCSTQIRPDVKIATFLRFLATGSYQRAIGNENVSSTSKATVHRIITECLQMFEEWICPQWIQMPRIEEEPEIIENFFDRTGFPGVIGCVDGTHIRIKSPGEELKCLYYNRKGYCSINAMMICDYKMTIMFVDARHPGSNHDAFIWEHSLANQKLQEKFEGGKRNVWILGDGGYKLKPFLLTPFRNPKDIYERRFNTKHISTRNVVERCFGVLKNRFRCIIGSRGLHYSPEQSTKIINACCAVHNMCIKYRCVQEFVDEVEVRDDPIANEDNEGEEAIAVAIRRSVAINL